MADLHARLAQQPTQRHGPTLHSLADNADAVTSLLPDVLRLTADLVHTYTTEVQPWAVHVDHNTANAALDATDVVAVISELQSVVDAAGDVSAVYNTLQQLQPPPTPAVPATSTELLLSTTTRTRRQAQLPMHLVPRFDV